MDEVVERIVRRQVSRVRLPLEWCGIEREDAAQIVRLAVHLARRRLDPSRSQREATSYLHEAARTTIQKEINAARRQKRGGARRVLRLYDYVRGPTGASTTVFDTLMAPEEPDELEFKELYAAVRRRCRTKMEADVTMRFVLDEDQQEAAQRIGVSRQAVNQCERRLMARVRKAT